MKPSGSQRPPSSLSQRSDSRASQRPLSRTSQRPASSVGQRPPSSSSHRPTSSASIRPSSRTTQRPGSRLSRPVNKQTSRFLPQCQKLITQVTGLTSQGDSERFQAATDVAIKQLDSTKAMVGIDMSSINRQIEGHATKARINSRDPIAEALELAYNRLNNAVKSDDSSQTIRLSHLPDHLQLLISLSLPPSNVTVAFAESFLEDLRNLSNPPPTLTWQDILAEDPLSGQHWEGVYGLPPGSTVEKWDTHSTDSTESLSPADRSEDNFQDEDGSLSSPSADESTSPANSLAVTKTLMESNGQTFSHRNLFERFHSKQYWRQEWKTDASLITPFDLGDASTLGPSFSAAIGERTAVFIGGPERERYINESDAVREVLMALQGRKNMLLTWFTTAQSQSFVPSTSAPRLVHVTLATFSSLLTSFAKIATVLERLRKFVSSVSARASQLQSEPKATNCYLTHTLEAFSDAIDQEIHAFDDWCARKEADICQAQTGVGLSAVVSLLWLENALRDKFSESFSAVSDVLHGVLTQTSRTSEKIEDFSLLVNLPAKVPPSTITCLLLDHLLQTVQTYWSLADISTCNALVRVFVKTAEPIWAMVGRWLRNGMPLRDSGGRLQVYGDMGIDEEFFIEDNEMTLLEAEFWADGYTLRGKWDYAEDESSYQRTTPAFLDRISEAILASGKAVGLLRALDINPWADGTLQWRSFDAMLTSSSNAIYSTITESSFALSADTLTRVVHDELLPQCKVAGGLLIRVVLDDCLFWQHLFAIEGIYLMQKGDTMSHYTDVLFARMDSHQQWSDFHFLNSAFSSIIEAQKTKWVQAPLVRLAYRGSKDKSISRTVKALDGLSVEYAVPFPLTYIFTPAVLHLYGSIFVFLLQIRRAKSNLEQILLRGAIANENRTRTELKAFYALRSRLSWFVNTLLNFLTTYVIHAQILRFHSDLQNPDSLDSIIQLHDAHIGKIQSRCLLNANMSALHRAVISILDMCLCFSDFLVEFAGDVTHDVSKTSIHIRRHQSRRQRRQRRNVIGFSQSIQYDSSDEDDEDGEDEPSFFTTMSSMIGVEEPPASDRLDQMSSELDSLVRFIRRGVETLAGGTSEAAPAFGVLAFALEDWDL